MSLKRIAKVFFLFFVSTILSVSIQAQDLVLELTPSLPTLLKGEEGEFTFALSNKGNATVENITVAFTRKGEGFDVVTATPHGTDTFEGKTWNISKLEAGVSTGLTLRLKSKVPYLQFLAEVVFPNNEMAVNRCYNADCYNSNDFYCFYKCDLAADEVRYPSERATLDVTTMVCALETKSTLPDCSATYNISIKNSSDMPSAPTHIALWAYLIPRGGQDYYSRIGNSIAIPSIPAGKSYSLTADFNPCEQYKAVDLSSYEKNFKALQALYLIFAEDEDSTENPPPSYKLSNLEFKHETAYCYPTDVGVSITSNDVISSDDLMKYQVTVTNNGTQTAKMVQVAYATIDGGLEKVQSKTSAYTNSTFSVDDDSAMRFQDVPQYWNIKDLAAGASATLDVVLKAKGKEIGRYPLKVYLNTSVREFEETVYTSDFTDTDASNNSASTVFNRATTTSDAVTDIDGNTYKTVTIGNQTWIAENLRTTKCSNGKTIPEIATNNWFDYTGIGLRPSANIEKYGYLYNQYTLDNSTCSVCPKGWRVPSKSDLQALLDYLGTDAGSKLRATEDWDMSSTNSSGWSAVRTGFITPHGKLVQDQRGFYWSDTKSGSKTSNYSLTVSGDRNDFTQMNMYIAKYGFAIRCIKN